MKKLYAPTEQPVCAGNVWVYMDIKVITWYMYKYEQVDQQLHFTPMKFRRNFIDGPSLH